MKKILNNLPIQNPRKEYKKPILLKLGDLRTITMGSSSSGFSDSGSGPPYTYVGPSPPSFPDEKYFP